MSDNVNKPAHYTQQPVECIEFTQHMNFCMGNAFKYIWRYADKNGVEDLKKAQWYLRRQLAVWPDFAGVEEAVWWELDSGLSACEFGIHQYSVLYMILVAAAGDDTARPVEDTARSVLEDALNQLAKLIEEAV